MGIAYSYKELAVGVISVASSVPISGNLNRVALELSRPRIHHWTNLHRPFVPLH